MSTYQIAIDPGVHTGLAIAVDGVLVDVRTCSFWDAEYQIMAYHANDIPIELIIEDPRGIYVPPGQRNPQRIQLSRTLRRIYFRIFKRYRRLEHRFVSYAEVSEWWQRLHEEWDYLCRLYEVKQYDMISGMLRMMTFT